MRPSGRVILIGPGARTLLLRGGDPHRPHDGTWWFTPGGAVDPGETSEAAAHRELWEETGQSEVEWGGLVARRQVAFDFLGATYLAREDFYVAFTDRLAVKPGGLTPVEEEVVEEYRWLDPTAIAHLIEPVYPHELATVLPGLSAKRYPTKPWVWAE